MNCLMSGGYTEVGEKESIMFQLEFQGICVRDGFTLSPVQVGDFKLYMIKFRSSPVGQMYDTLDTAATEFMKLTEDL